MFVLVSVSEKKMQYRPPKSYYPNFPSCIRPVPEGREGLRKVVWFLFSWYQMFEIEHVSEV